MSLLRTTIAFACCLLVTALAPGCGPEENDSPAGVSFDTEAPSTPSGLTASQLPDGRVLLTWRANRTDPDLAGYVIYRSERLEGGYTPVLAEPVRSNSWIDEEIVAGRTTYYRVSARDATSNESAPSPIATPGTDAPVPTAAAVLQTPSR